MARRAGTKIVKAVAAGRISGVHTVDASDLMRRLVKEQLLKFDGTPLFPERRAYTVGYKLSDAEAALYKSVTDYVREEPDDFILAIGQADGAQQTLVYVRRPFQQEPEFAAESINYKLQERLARGELPA